MRPEPLHGWSLSVREAIDLQSRIACGVIRKDRLGPVRLVAGVDVAYDRRGRSSIARAAVVVLSFPDLAFVEQAAIEVAVDFPYVPGLLTFREAPAAIAALDRLTHRPDVLLCDGQGLAHPRRLGFAAHLGLFLDTPSVGVAKSVLVGTYAEPGPAKGDWSPLIDKDEVIGAALQDPRRRAADLRLHRPPGLASDGDLSRPRLHDLVPAATDDPRRRPAVEGARGA